MNPLYRGLVEQGIDQMIEETQLKLAYKVFKRFKELYLIDSIESAMFADIFTRAAVTIRLCNLDREPNSKEILEFNKLFASRANEIKSRITEICNI